MNKQLQITEMEAGVIKAYKDNDIVGDYGFDDFSASGWVDSISEEAAKLLNCPLSSMPGIFSSLSKKGIISTDGEVVRLTSAGIEIAKAL